MENATRHSQLTPIWVAASTQLDTFSHTYPDLGRDSAPRQPDLVERDILEDQLNRNWMARIGVLNLVDPRSDFLKSPNSRRLRVSVKTLKSVTNLRSDPSVLRRRGQNGALSQHGAINVPEALHALACRRAFDTRNTGGTTQFTSLLQSCVKASTASHCGFQNNALYRTVLVFFWFANRSIVNGPHVWLRWWKKASLVIQSS